MCTDKQVDDTGYRKSFFNLVTVSMWCFLNRHETYQSTVVAEHFCFEASAHQ